MTKTPEEIAAIVGQALQEVLASDDYPVRLEPFTAAQLRFIRQFLVEALTRLLAE